MTVQQMQKDYEEVVKEIFKISDTATKEGRSISDEEHLKATELYTEAKRLKDEIANEQAKSDLMADVRALGNIGVVDPEPKPAPEPSPSPIITPRSTGWKSLGTQFVESAEYRLLMKRGLEGEGWSTGPIQLKTLLTETDGSGGDLVQPQVIGLRETVGFRRPVVADLMPSGTTNSSVVRYLKETTATNAASTVAEGGTKPDATLVFDVVDEPVRKIAVGLPVTDEMLEDGPQIRSYIDNRLRLFVQLEEENQLLNGDGSDNDLRGLLNRTGVQTQALGGDTGPDAAYKAITLIRVNAFLEPDGMVVHPTDWQDHFRLAKDGNDQYYGGGPFMGPYGVNGIASDNLWGMNVVVTPAIAAGTALVGAFRTAAQVFRRSGLVVEASNSHSTFFMENKTQIRAEERLALAVYRPAAFAKVTGL